MPPVPPRKPRSCVEILARLGDKASWDDFLASVAASADEDAGSTGADGPPVPGNEDDQRLLEARQIADLRRRLGLD